MNYNQPAKYFIIKKITCFFTLLLCLGFCYTVVAQNPELFSHTWYLQKMVINGVDHFPPSNTEVPWVDLNFSDNPDASFQSSICNGAYGDIAFDNMADSFEFIDWALSLGSCNLPVNNSFEQIYFPFYQEYTYNNAQPFDYEVVTETHGDKTLTITSASGDKTVYGNQQMSVKNASQVSFHLYPNPVKNDFYLQSKSGTKVEEVGIYNLSGKEVLHFSKSSTYDISNLQSGIYFVKVQIDRGVSIERIVKK